MVCILVLLCESLWQGETLIWERARQRGDPARAMLCERECVFDSASPEWEGKSDATSRVLTMIPVLTMRHSAKSAFSTPSRFILAMHFRPLLPQHCNKLKWKFGCGRARRKFSPPRHKAAQEAARSQIRLYSPERPESFKFRRSAASDLPRPPLWPRIFGTLRPQRLHNGSPRRRLPRFENLLMRESRF